MLPTAQLVGNLALAQLPAAVLTNGTTGVTLTGTFTGNGAGLTNLNASQINIGTVPPARLPALWRSGQQWPPATISSRWAATMGRRTLIRHGPV